MATKSTKSSAASNGNGHDAVASMMTAGAGNFKENVEKAVEGFDRMAEFSRLSLEAWIQSANAATKGFETLNNEALAFSRQSVEDSVSVAKAAMSVKNVQELYDIQSEFAKTAFDAYVGQMSKVGEVMAQTAKDSIDPLTGRVQAAVDLMKTPA